MAVMGYAACDYRFLYMNYIIFIYEKNNHFTCHGHGCGRSCGTDKL